MQNFPNEIVLLFEEYRQKSIKDFQAVAESAGFGDDAIKDGEEKFINQSIKL